MITEKNVPTNPSLWKKFVNQAKKKFDVYPSAYANGWASKQYKDAGGKWKTESVETPQRVAQALPQTKEVDPKQLGERFLEYLKDNGLKHAAYMNEEGRLKIVGLNREQVKKALETLIKEHQTGVTGTLNEQLTVTDYEEHRNPAKITVHLSNGKSFDIKPKSNYREKDYQKWFTLLNNYHRDSKIKKFVDDAINARFAEGLPGGAGVGVSLPGGYINAAPSSKDVAKMRAGIDKQNMKESALSSILIGAVALLGGAVVKTFGELFFNSVVDGARAVYGDIKNIVAPEPYIRFLKKLENNDTFNKEFIKFTIDNKKNNILKGKNWIDVVASLPSFVSAFNTFATEQNLSEDDKNQVLDAIKTSMQIAYITKADVIYKKLKQKYPEISSEITDGLIREYNKKRNL